jgi:hypothetical protein
VEYTNSVFPRDPKIMPSGFQLDWTGVGFIASTRDSYQLRSPSVLKNGQVVLGNVMVGGPKRVDGLGNGYAVDDTLVVAELLEITDKGMVFVIGFK